MMQIWCRFCTEWKNYTEFPSDNRSPDPKKRVAKCMNCISPRKFPRAKLPKKPKRGADFLNAALARIERSQHSK